MMINTGTSAASGNNRTIICFIFAPPKNSIANMIIPVHIVTDIFGSAIMSRQIPPPAARTGSIPTNVRMRSGFSLQYAEANTTNPYLEISDGWIVIGPIPIQRVAP